MQEERLRAGILVLLGELYPLGTSLPLACGSVAEFAQLHNEIIVVPTLLVSPED